MSTVKEFLGPVKQVNKYWTELEDRSLLVTPEHHENLELWFREESEFVEEAIGRVYSYLQLNEAEDKILDECLAQRVEPTKKFNLLQKGAIADLTNKLTFYAGALAYKDWTQCRTTTETQYERPTTNALILERAMLLSHTALPDTHTLRLREYAMLMHRTRGLKRLRYLKYGVAIALLSIIGTSLVLWTVQNSHLLSILTKP